MRTTLAILLAATFALVSVGPTFSEPPKASPENVFEVVVAIFVEVTIDVAVDKAIKEIKEAAHMEQEDMALPHPPLWGPSTFEEPHLTP